MTHVSRGGTIAPGRGDLTGARIQALSSRKDDYSAAKANMKNALDGEQVTIISVTGGRSYLCPVELADFLLAEGRRSD
jgi:hypothetical protein